jgi:quercetin dioxygenase-like cupin family protein
MSPRGDLRVDGTVVMAGEQAIFSIQRDRAHRSLDTVSIHLDATVVEETHEAVPVLEAIADRLRGGALVRDGGLAQSDDPNLPHIGLVGDTYTILVAGEDTAGRYCLIDMHIPPGGGPPPHRHDFEEMFSILEGEIEATFRGKKTIIRAGETINIPTNAPHQFQNKSGEPARLLCICSPAGQEEFFREVGVPVATRTTPPPPLDREGDAAFAAKVKALAPKYRTELLRP